MASIETSRITEGLDHVKVNILKGNEPVPFVARKYDRGVHLPECVHKHPEAEVCFMPWDTGVMLLDGRAHRFCPGDMFLISGNTYHHPVFDSPNNRGLIVVYFSSQFIDQIPSAWPDLKALLSIPGGEVKLEGNVEAAQLMLELEKLLQSPANQKEAICQGIFLHLMAHFVEELRLQSVNAGNRVSLNRFSNTLAFIDSKLSSEISLSDLYQMAGMSRSRFCEQFKACFGISPTQYIQRARLEKSKHLLRSTNLSINQIAYECGYNWPSFFNRVFKDTLGVAPSEFRRRTSIITNQANTQK